MIARTTIPLVLAVPFLLATAPEESGEVADDFICGTPWIMEPAKARAPRYRSSAPSISMKTRLRDAWGPGSWGPGSKSMKIPT